MKNVLKTAFFAALLLVVACSEAVAEKETTVVAAIPTKEAIVKETCNVCDTHLCGQQMNKCKQLQMK